MFATAEIVGPAASRSLQRKKKFTIPNAFVRPLLDIVGDLNAMNPRALDAPWTSQERVQHLGLAGFKVRWMTFGILVVLVAVFICELKFAVGPIRPGLHPSLSTLLALGGLNRGIVLANGEWYRLLTAPLLHLDASHLMLNCIALLMAGFALEQLVGRAWLLALFVLGALGGSLASLAMNPSTITSVGASGAIMCMFAAVYVCSFRLPAGRDRTRMQVRSLYVMIPALIPLAAAATTRQIDYAAHFGGAVTGVLVGFLLLTQWPQASRIPEMRVLASGIAAIGIFLFIASSAAVANHYAGYKAFAAKGVDLMIPQNQLPKTTSGVESQAAGLLARYPRDPRSHMYQAIAFEKSHAYPAAERELRTSLQLANDLSPIVSVQFSNSARAMLAGVLLQEGQKTQARDAAYSVCHVEPAQQPAASLLKMLADAHLCD
jgi:rhomboid protease GluP